MRLYTTHGTGKNAKVLAVTRYDPARTITSCPAENAAGIARALTRTDRQIAAALYPVATTLDGQPVEARRRLLSVFDAHAADQNIPVTDEPWREAEQLAAAVGAAVAGLPAPVVTAVRAELADHLTGLDGVLVPARAVTHGHRRANLDVVISGALHRLGESFWTYLAGAHGDLSVQDDDPLFPLGGPLAATQEWYAVIDALYDTEPTAAAPFALSMEELVAETGDDGAPDLLVRVDHLLRYATAHRPELLAQLTSRLS